MVSTSNNTQVFDNVGRGPLHYAALAGNSAAARLLLLKNFDCGVKDDFGYPAVQYAAAYGHDDLVRVMVGEFHALLEPFATSEAELLEAANRSAKRRLASERASSLEDKDAEAAAEEVIVVDESFLLPEPPWSILAEFLSSVQSSQ
jgi:ankyrin repeat protein